MDSNKTHSRYHVVIVGGGLVGLSVAFALACLAKRDNGRQLKIAVVEAFNPPADDYIADNDPRTTALSYGTRLIYNALGIWERLAPYTQPIRHIHVSDRGMPGMVRLSAHEYAVPALGYVVPNKQLLRELVNVVEQQTDISFYRPATVESLNMLSEYPRLTLTQNHKIKTLDAELVVLADGGKSPLMKQMGFSPDIIDYKHTGILATVTHQHPHGARAFERFTSEGPMAMLPLLAGEQHKSAMIWTMPTEIAEERMQLTEDDFVRELQERFGFRLGKFEASGKRLGFPLRLKIVAEPVREGGLLMGNSAHSLHPVAGQGYNLALRDTMVLASLLTTTSKDQSLGASRLLQSYLQYQQSDQTTAITFSDSLVRLFSNRHPLLQAGRNAGLAMLDGLLPAKRWFGYKAMGLGGYGQ